MFESIRRFFCHHDYKQIHRITCKYLVREGLLIDKYIYFYVCPKCGKRLVILDEEHYYSKLTIDQIKLWLKYEIDYDFSDEDNKKKEENIDEDKSNNF